MKQEVHVAILSSSGLGFQGTAANFSRAGVWTHRVTIVYTCELVGFVSSTPISVMPMCFSTNLFEEQ